MKTALRIAQTIALLFTLAIIYFGLIAVPAGLQFLTVIPAIFSVITVWLPAVKISEIIWERDLESR